MTEEIMEPSVELTAGEMLRNARTTGRRKREIPTIAKQLCIREEFLTALEEGNYTLIPEVVYILGFARNYAMELGLNPDEVVAKIKREMGLVSDCVASDDERGDKGCAVPDAAKKRAGLFLRVKKYVVRNWKLIAGAVVLLAVLLGVVFTLVFAGVNSANDDTVNPGAATGQVAIAEPAYNMPVRERFGTENKANANVILQAIQESWVKVEDGRGNTVFSRVLVPGDVYYAPLGDKYKGTFGNAGGVDVWVDGQLAPKVGPAHTRKTGFSMAPASLMGTSAQ